MSLSPEYLAAADAYTDAHAAWVVVKLLWRGGGLPLADFLVAEAMHDASVTAFDDAWTTERDREVAEKVADLSAELPPKPDRWTIREF